MEFVSFCVIFVPWLKNSHQSVVKFKFRRKIPVLFGQPVLHLSGCCKQGIIPQESSASKQMKTKARPV
jgi:hypothetical protein